MAGLLKIMLWMIVTPGLMTIGFVSLSSLAARTLEPKRKFNLGNWLLFLCQEIPRAMAWFYLSLASRLWSNLNRFSPHAMAPNDRRRPTFLVPGYLDTVYSLKNLKARLELLKTGPVFAIPLKPAFAKIRILALELKKSIEAISRRRPQWLIGFSMGGIVVAYYNEFFTRKRSKNVLIIGSPLYGTHMADLFWGENVKEVKIESPILKELRERMVSNKETQYHLIAAREDNIIIPWKSALLFGRSLKKYPNIREYIISDVGHAGLLRTNAMPNLVESILKLPRPRNKT